MSTTVALKDKTILRLRILGEFGESYDSLVYRISDEWESLRIELDNRIQPYVQIPVPMNVYESVLNDPFTIDTEKAGPVCAISGIPIRGGQKYAFFAGQGYHLKYFYSVGKKEYLGKDCELVEVPEYFINHLNFYSEYTEEQLGKHGEEICPYCDEKIEVGDKYFYFSNAPYSHFDHIKNYKEDFEILNSSKLFLEPLWDHSGTIFRHLAE